LKEEEGLFFLADLEEDNTDEDDKVNHNRNSNGTLSCLNIKHLIVKLLFNC